MIPGTFLLLLGTVVIPFIKSGETRPSRSRSPKYHFLRILQVNTAYLGFSFFREAVCNSSAFLRLV